MITGKDLQYMGKIGSLHTSDGLRVHVEIINVRARFGSIDFLVTPVMGGGSAWVISDRVRFLDA